VQYKTAFVLAHKLREAMESELKNMQLGGGETIEVDGGYFGGYVKPANFKENRRDRRLAKNQNGKRQVVMRERGGLHAAGGVQVGERGAWLDQQPSGPRVNAARIFLRTAEVKLPSFADQGVALMSPFWAGGLGVSGLARVSAGR
jgi:hypothetical protein